MVGGGVGGGGCLWLSGPLEFRVFIISAHINSTWKHNIYTALPLKSFNGVSTSHPHAEVTYFMRPL